MNVSGSVPAGGARGRAAKAKSPAKDNVRNVTLAVWLRGNLSSQRPPTSALGGESAPCLLLFPVLLILVHLKQRNLGQEVAGIKAAAPEGPEAADM